MITIVRVSKTTKKRKDVYNLNALDVQNSTTTLAPIPTSETPPTSTTSVPSISTTTGAGAAPPARK